MGDFGISEILSTVIAVAVQAGTTLLAKVISAPKSPDSPVKIPPNDITRGGYLPLVIGRRVVGCQVGWVGDRKSHAGGHSGGSEISPGGPTPDLFYEGASHQLCHGPVRRCYRIWTSGLIVGSVLLDSTLDADGVKNQLRAQIVARDSNYYRFYFGRDPNDDPSFQPVDAYLVKRTGIPSCYPGLCYCCWQRKALGNSTTWPPMKYEVETRPEDIFAMSGLEDIFTPVGIPTWFDETNPAETFGENRIIVWLNGKQSLPAGTYTATYLYGAFKLNVARGWQVFSQSSAYPNFEMSVCDSAGTDLHSLPWINAGLVNAWDTQAEAEAANANASITFTWPGGIMGFQFSNIHDYPGAVNGQPNPTYNVSNGTNTYQASIAVQGSAAGSGDSGCNPAAALYILACAPFPWGCGRPVSIFDQTALLAMGTTAAAERIPVNILVEKGGNADDAIASLMGDVGFLLPQVGVGIKPYLIRTETSAPEITDDLRVGGLPEHQQVVGDLMATRFTWQFNDVLNGYATTDLTLDNDAQASQNNRPQAATITLNNITDRRTALKVVNRRTPELASSPQVVAPFTALREVRNPIFHPGRTFIRDGEIYRLTSWKPDMQGISAELGSALDQYGDTSISYDTSSDGWNTSQPLSPPPEPDLFFAPFVIPRSEWPSITTPVFGVPRVRANSAVTGASIWISNASTGTYTQVGEQDPPSAGGLLLTAYNGTSGVLVVGPSIAPFNDDILDVPDLTGNPSAYAGGDLTVLVEQEIQLLESTTLDLTGNYQLNNVSTGAFNTTPAAHTTGTPLVIVFREDMNGIPTPLLAALSPAGGTLWVKTQPTDGLITVDLSLVTPEPLIVPPNLLATITVVPILGPVYIGTIQPIQWTTTNLTGTLDIYLSLDGGVTFTLLAGGLADSGSYLWDTTGATASPTAVIKISSTLSPFIYSQTYPFELGVDIVTPAFNVDGGPVSYFNGGRPVPAGPKTITYLSGGLDYGGGGTTFEINGNLTTNCFQIAYNNGSAVLTAPGNTTTYTTIAALQTANAGASVTFNHSGGTIGISLQDSPIWTHNTTPTPVAYGLT